MSLQNFSQIIVWLYFLNLGMYSLTSLFDLEEPKTVFWFVRIPILMLLYYKTSVTRSFLYFTGLLLYQIASVLFFTGDPALFIVGSVASVLFKFCLVLFIINDVKKENRLAVLMAMIPFFVLYLYIINFVLLALGDFYWIWIINALLTSFMGGVAIINYLNNADAKGYWLLISAILFIVQIAAFFINKFYLKSEAIYQIVILSYGFAHFTFYRFLILKEKEEIGPKDLSTS